MSQSGEKAFADAIRKSQPGKVTEPAQSKMGWHLLRCAAPTAPKTVDFADVRGPLTARLTAQRGDESLRKYVAELRKHARIEIDDAALARISAEQR